MIQRTLIILKPDAVARGLMGRILQRFEDKGLKVIGAKLKVLEKSLVETHYQDHAGKPFYPGLVQYMSGGPVMVLAFEGPSAIEVCRNLMGATFGPNAAAGTIRGDLTSSRGLNLVHGSDGPESAERELGLFFEAGELLDYERPMDASMMNDEDKN